MQAGYYFPQSVLTIQEEESRQEAQPHDGIPERRGVWNQAVNRLSAVRGDLPKSFSDRGFSGAG